MSHLTAVIQLQELPAMICAKVIIFVFHHVSFDSRISCQNSAPESLAFSLFGNRAEISHITGPGNLGSPANWARVKRPLLVGFYCTFRTRVHIGKR